MRRGVQCSGAVHVNQFNEMQNSRKAGADSSARDVAVVRGLLPRVRRQLFITWRSMSHVVLTLLSYDPLWLSVVLSSSKGTPPADSGATEALTVMQSDGFDLLIDALELGLRFPLHPVIEACPKGWHISPNQVAANSWRYLVAFLWECYGSGIAATLDLFTVCFRLSRGQIEYYLTARSGFRVGGAPSSNKGCKSRFFFISCCQGWGFPTKWMSRSVDNLVSTLLTDEIELVEVLRGIMSASKGVKDINEAWLAEASLSPAPRGKGKCRQRLRKSPSGGTPSETCARWRTEWGRTDTSPLS
ncbi:hypothetical protein BHE74_00018223 [Ensete ventricosum]|nr:hypothetical protein BHE74_00018223 [Ensete ventricosum]